MKLHSAFDIEAMRKALPELPNEKRLRYAGLGIKAADAEVFVTDSKLAAYIEEVIKDKSADFSQTAANYIVSDLLGLIKLGEGVHMPQVNHFTELIEMVVNKEITSRTAKDLLTAITVTTSYPPRAMAQEKGLLQQNNADDLKPVIAKIIEANPKIIADYKAGKEAALQGLVGQVMKETKGAANPALTLQLLKDMVQ
jgi:aspartyl-tRNA(Asn)/glutamyl-tRNA(Gln) amidotransferase subunit B